MNKVVLTSTIFIIAIVIGFTAAVVFLPSDAQATVCDEEDYQWLWECDSPSCSAPTPHARWRCGTEKPGGDTCACILLGCSLLCG